MHVCMSSICPSSIFNLNTFYINHHMYVHHRSPFICPSSVCLLSVFSSVRLLSDHHMYCTCPCSFLFIIYPSVYTVCLSSILCPFFMRFYLHVFCVSLYIYILLNGRCHRMFDPNGLLRTPFQGAL